MNILKRLTKEKSHNDGMHSSILFAIGGLLGGLSTYLFLTEGGARYKARIISKIQQRSAQSSEAFMLDAENEDQLSQQSEDAKAETEKAMESKAHKMVSHLKEVNQHKTNDASDNDQSDQ